MVERRLSAVGEKWSQPQQQTARTGLCSPPRQESRNASCTDRTAPSAGFRIQTDVLFSGKTRMAIKVPEYRYTDGKSNIAPVPTGQAKMRCATVNRVQLPAIAPIRSTTMVRSLNPVGGGHPLPKPLPRNVSGLRHRRQPFQMSIALIEGKRRSVSDGIKSALTAQEE